MRCIETPVLAAKKIIKTNLSNTLLIGNQGGTTYTSQISNSNTRVSKNSLFFLKMNKWSVEDSNSDTTYWNILFKLIDHR